MFSASNKWIKQPETIAHNKKKQAKGNKCTLRPRFRFVSINSFKNSLIT